MKTILAIETSCDDTSIAILQDGEVLSNVISSQPIHNEWGGIVPELASREHVKAISYLVTSALKEANLTIENVSAIAVTNGPGLAGSLLVGTQFAKGLSLRYSLPVYPVHHIEAHIYSGYLEDPELMFPSVCLVVSGGHTSVFKVNSINTFEVLGSTRDDAAGEAFDKVAKLLGLGYPGGPHIDRLAKDGDPEAIEFPRGLSGHSNDDFSFSGLKTSVRYYLRDNPSYNINDVCASVQRAIVDVLVHKTIRAAGREKVGAVTIAGGVSANSELRARMQTECSNNNLIFVAPRMDYCVDNAAMIGYLASARLLDGALPSDLDFVVDPRAIRASR